MALVVGQGIKDAMNAAGDAPARDSTFGANSDGSQWEQGYGFKGVYIASNAGGQWKTTGPLPVGGA